MSRKYTVITPRRFHTSLSRLLAQKEQRGYTVAVKYVEDLNGAASVPDQIRNYLLAAEPACVLLVGDDHMTPGYRLPTHHSPPREFVSDAFLVMNDLDKYPRIPIGRLSVDENMKRMGPQGIPEPVPPEEQVEAMCKALVAYPDSTSPAWQHRVVLCGWTPRGPSHPGFTADAAHRCLQEIGHYADVVMAFESDLQASDQAKCLWGTHDSSIAGLKVSLENGALLLRYAGHGGTTSWDNIGSRDAGDSVGRSFVRSLNIGAASPLVISVSCHTGDLPTSPSFGETWQTERKAIGFFGADDESDTYFNDRLNFTILEEYYRNKRTMVGEIIQQALKHVCEEYRHAAPHERSFDNTILMYRYLGDPDTRLPSPDSRKIILDDTSHCGPAAATSGDRLLLGWTGVDGNAGLSFASSTDGRTFTNRVTHLENSGHALSLAVFRVRHNDRRKNRYFVAWADSAGGRLNVMQSDDGVTWDSKVTLDDTSDSAPVLAVYRNRLHLAWRGTDDRLNIRGSTDGLDWGEKHTLAETTRSGPALTGGTCLLLAWRGLNDKLNVMRSFGGGYSFGDKVTLAETTPARPYIHVHQGRPHLAWRGMDHRLNIIESSNAGKDWFLKRTLVDSAIDSPALATLGDKLICLWTGTGRAHHLNVLPCRLRM